MPPRMVEMALVGNAPGFWSFPTPLVHFACASPILARHAPVDLASNHSPSLQLPHPTSCCPGTPCFPNASGRESKADGLSSLPVPLHHQFRQQSDKILSSRTLLPFFLLCLRTGNTGRAITKSSEFIECST